MRPVCTVSSLSVGSLLPRPRRARARSGGEPRPNDGQRGGTARLPTQDYRLNLSTDNGKRRWWCCERVERIQSACRIPERGRSPKLAKHPSQESTGSCGIRPGVASFDRLKNQDFPNHNPRRARPFRSGSPAILTKNSRPLEPGYKKFQYTLSYKIPLSLLRPAHCGLSSQRQSVRLPALTAGSASQRQRFQRKSKDLCFCRLTPSKENPIYVPWGRRSCASPAAASPCPAGGWRTWRAAPRCGPTAAAPPGAPRGPTGSAPRSTRWRPPRRPRAKTPSSVGDWEHQRWASSRSEPHGEGEEWHVSRIPRDVQGIEYRLKFACMQALSSGKDDGKSFKPPSGRRTI